MLFKYVRSLIIIVFFFSSEHGEPSDTLIRSQLIKGNWALSNVKVLRDKIRKKNKNLAIK